MGSLRLKRPIRLSRGREVWAALGSGPFNGDLLRSRRRVGLYTTEAAGLHNDLWPAILATQKCDI